MMQRTFFLLFTTVLLLLSLPARAQSGEALLQRVQQQYAAAEGLRAAFTQHTISPFAADTVTFQGTLLLKGTKFRVETPQQTLVTDGDTTWIYNPATNQVIVNQYVNDETTITPDELFSDYLDRYNITSTRTVERNGTALAIIKLAAETPDSYYPTATLHIRRQDAMLMRVQLTDQNGATTIFALDQVQLSPSFAADAFTFTPPAGAEVVDLRS